MKPVNTLAETLALACRTREGARAIAPTLGGEAAREALVWAIGNAARGDLVLAPLVDGVAAHAELRAEAAVARLARGEALYDALACLPRAHATGRVVGPVRRRVEALCWELAARGDAMPSLGAWLAHDPAAVRELVTDAAGRELHVRARAARVLAVIADGIADATNLPLASELTALATTWLGDAEPQVWTYAARALGRLAGRVSAAHRALHAWSARGNPAWRVRRIAAALGAMPQAYATDWVDDQLALVLSPEEVARDPWRVAALGAAAANLSREHPRHWHALLELAFTGPLEVAWGAAQGLAALGRHGNGRGLAASEREAVIAIRARVAQLPRRSTDEAARAHACEVELGRALGEPAPTVLVLEATDDAIRGHLAGRAATPRVSPREAYATAVTALGAPDEATRGIAHAIMRSATRAHALRIHELVETPPPAGAAVGGTLVGARVSSPGIPLPPVAGSNAGIAVGSSAGISTSTAVLGRGGTSRIATGEPARDFGFEEFVLDDTAARLAKEVGEYGVRHTLVACLGDLIDGASDHGRVAARALRTVATSRWARDEVLAGDDAARAKAVRRFKKPLEDLVDRATPRRLALGTAPIGAPRDARHETGTRDRDPVENVVAPQLAAWWALCGGGAAFVAELERASPARAALQSIERALADAALGLSAARWSEQLAAALVALDAADTLLARAIARLGAAVEALAAADHDALAAAVAPLAGAVDMVLAVARDLDAAMLVDRAPDVPASGEVAADRRRDARASFSLDAHVLAHWEAELPPALAAIVVPLARGATSALAHTLQVRRGSVIGGFELVDKLGGGGMGEVWKARRGRQLVALKLPHPDAAPADRAHLAEILRAESNRLEGVSIAKVVTFIEAGVDRAGSPAAGADTPYLATAYLRGRTLFEHALAPTALAARGTATIDLALVRRVARDAATGLANLHELGVVHRDVTPRNIFLRFRGQDPAPIPALADDPHGKRIDEAVLIDLGIAQRIADRASPHASIGYVAPEILAGEPVGPAADVYGLGATLFHVLTGMRFADGLTASRAIAWHIATDPFDDAGVRSAASAHLTPAFAELLAAATRLDPARRATLEAFDAELG